MPTVTGYVRMLNNKGPGLAGHVRLRLIDDPDSEIVFEGPCRANCMAVFRAAMNSRIPVEVTLSATPEATAAKLIGLPVSEPPSKPAPKKPDPIEPVSLAPMPPSVGEQPRLVPVSPVVETQIAPPAESEDESLDDFLSLMSS